MELVVLSAFMFVGLSVCVILKEDGSEEEEDTASHVLGGLDCTSAPGLAGGSFALLRNVDPEVLKPLLSPFFGQGTWDYSDQYHQRVHNLLISNVGVAFARGPTTSGRSR